ncbi:MAG TPA: roadblock/LC7 domain-containing protein [Gemmatimonadales bacterium]|nr:roadblock/LC7 domain-containing protein [Gemmatimonadales bacterium]HXS23387.1 roadblock/LC7 domain-containing protein [Gemmatimonadales bacterium]
MTALGEVVRAFGDRPDVAAVVLASADGLPIHTAGRRSVDPDSTAALAATFVRQAAALSEATGLGEIDTAVLESARGLAVVARVGTDWLVVVPSDSADAGALLYHLRVHRPALAALL